jgi:hypothetical protein
VCAVNLQVPGIGDVVIQAILRHNNLSVTRTADIGNDGLDPKRLAAMKALESAACNQGATAVAGTGSRTDVTP